MSAIVPATSALTAVDDAGWHLRQFDPVHLAISFCGGRDSTVMLDALYKAYAGRHPLHVIFADTGWEHPDAEEWCRSIVEGRYGLPLHVVRNPNKDLLSMVRARGMFPSPQYRQCTSDLKVGPIYKWLRNEIQDFRIVQAIGLRASESAARKKKQPWSVNKTLTNSKRAVVDWLPIHQWTDKDVSDYVIANDLPLHPVYEYLPRFSCRVCIMMSGSNLIAVADNDPEAIEIIAELEADIGFTMFPAGPIRQVIEAAREKRAIAQRQPIQLDLFACG